jgi:tetratricopeptide (TPR) repeat protein
VTGKTLEPAIADGCALLQLLGPVQLKPLDLAQARGAVLGRRTLCLVTYLAIIGDTDHRRDHLATLLWESRGTEQALASLRQCLAELKSLFPDVLVAGRTTLRINAARLKTDVSVLAEITGAAALADAIRTLPQHVLVLPDVSRAFDDWVKTERKRLYAQLADIVRARLAKGDASVEDRAELKAAWRAVAPADAPAIDDATVEHGMQPGPGRSRISDRMPIAPNDAPLLIMAPVEFFGIAEGRELAEQLRDEVVGGLARIRDLRLVVERQPISAIPLDRHGDGYLLHSRLRNLSDGPQLTLQLLTWPAQEILWSTTTPFALAVDYEAVTHTIGKVVGSILPELERNLLRSERPASGSLYARYLKARYASRQPSDFQAARAIADELEAIIAQDPGFVLPYLPLARLYNTDFVYTRAGSSGVTERDRATWLSRRSTTIDPGHAHGWSQLAWSHLWQGQWSAAEDCLEQALALNPFHADRLDEIAFAFMHLGKLERAELLLERSKSLMVAPGHIYWNDRMLLDLLNGDPIAAVRSATNAGDDFLWSTVYSLAAHAHAGRDCRDAEQRFRTRVARIFPNGVLPQFDDLAFWMRRSGMPFRQSAMLNIVLDGIRIGLGRPR